MGAPHGMDIDTVVQGFKPKQNGRSTHLLAFNMQPVNSSCWSNRKPCLPALVGCPSVSIVPANEDCSVSLMSAVLWVHGKESSNFLSRSLNTELDRAFGCHHSTVSSKFTICTCGVPWWCSCGRVELESIGNVPVRRVHA